MTDEMVRHQYDQKLGEITIQDREYAKDILDEISDHTSSIEDVAQWLRKVRYEAVMADRATRQAPDREAVIDGETIQTLLDLLNPLHGSLDNQTYDEKMAQNFDAPRDAEYAVNVTAQQERDLTQAVLILEDRKRALYEPHEKG